MSSGVQEFRSSGVQEFRSSGVQEFRSLFGMEDGLGSQAITLKRIGSHRILQLLNSCNS
jgi:hypothetical protein